MSIGEHEGEFQRIAKEAYLAGWKARGGADAKIMQERSDYYFDCMEGEGMPEFAMHEWAAGACRYARELIQKMPDPTEEGKT